jgi:cytochrome c
MRLLLVGLSVIVTLHAASIPNGKEFFERRCSGCHSLDSEKEGPRLRGVYGRPSGTVESYTYSDALKKAHLTWDSDSLDKWLTNPDELVPQTDMTFHVENPGERSAIIAYLKTLR